MRLAALLAIVALATGLLAGCGGSSADEESGPSPPPRAGSAPAGAGASSCATGAAAVAELRVVAASCAEGRQVLAGWRAASDCSLAPAASRGGCAVPPYRCTAVRADRGVAVSCARPGRTVSFLVRD